MELKNNLILSQDLTEELINTQKLAIEENKTVRESLLKKIEEQKTEVSTQKESYEHLEQANRDFMKENENLKKSLKVIQEIGRIPC